MNKNYINIIRNSLNNSEENPKRNKKIVFPLCDYKSESVFVEKCNTYKKINNKTESHNLTVTKEKTTKSKKRKISASITENTQEWNIIEEKSEGTCQLNLTPSKSEILPRTIQVNLCSDSEESEHFVNLCSDSEESANFEVDEFFESRDHTSDKSITEAHSGINNEFKTCFVKSIHKSRNKIVETEKQDLEQDLGLDLCKKNFNNYNTFESEINGNRTNPVHLNISVEKEQLSAKSEPYEKTSEISFERFQIVKDSGPLESDVSSNLSSDNYEIENSLQVINATYFDFDNFKLVILKEQRSISIYGSCKIQILKGQIEILGSILNKSDKKVNVYSPRGQSLLVLKNTAIDEEEVFLTELYEFPNLNEDIRNTIVEKKSTVFLCFKLKDERLRFVQKYISQHIFPKFSNENLPQVIFEPKDNINEICINEDWENIVKLSNSSTKLFIAGGKGVGKSTFLRYMINKLLGKFDEIRVIDLDPGQSEFFVPGSISILSISEPVIGPNFTHMKSTERSYLCDISVADPVSYIRNVRSLMDYVFNLDKMITLINYMGYTNGLAINVVSTVIALVKPTNIVQIESQKKNKNFVCDLNVPNIRKNCDYFGGDPTNLNHRLHKVMSLAGNNTGWKLEPRLARELCLLAYLGEGMTEVICSLTDHNLPMYEFKLSSMKLRDLRNNEISPASINANLVGLCNLDENYGNFICLGFGVVRGIDLENDYLVLITQVNPEVLDKISYLVLGSVSLPPSIYMTPQNIRGLMPFVMEGELTSLARLTRRSYLPAGHKSTK